MKIHKFKNKQPRKRNKQSVFTIILLIFLIVYCITLFGLIYWGVITAFKDYDKDYYMNNTYGLPREWIESFTYIFTKFGIGVQKSDGSIGYALLPEILLNSFLYSAGSAFFKTLIPCITAYACSRFNFKLGKFIYTCVIVAMIIPIVGSLPSEIKVASALGLYNSIPGMWVMKANMLGMYFLVMYNAFKSMPNEYVEAAKIDGANNFQVFARIGLPLIATTFGTVFLINFVEYWNDYQTPLIYLVDHPTMGLSLYTLYSGGSLIAKNPQFTISFSIVLVAPTLILFLFTHKKLMSNITVGGLKG